MELEPKKSKKGVVSALLAGTMCCGAALASDAKVDELNVSSEWKYNCDEYDPTVQLRYIRYKNTWSTETMVKAKREREFSHKGVNYLSEMTLWEEITCKKQTDRFDEASGCKTLRRFNFFLGSDELDVGWKETSIYSLVDPASDVLNSSKLSYYLSSYACDENYTDEYCERGFPTRGYDSVNLEYIPGLDTLPVGRAWSADGKGFVAWKSNSIFNGLQSFEKKFREVCDVDYFDE